MEKQVSTDFLSLANLKERGWTATAIKRFLGTPDRQAFNPHYRSAPPMRLYEQARVEQVETTDTFVAWKAAIDGRRPAMRDRAAATANRKRLQLFEAVEALSIGIPQFAHDTLIKQACQHYNDLWQARGESDKWVTADAPPEFLQRISVNFLRHCCSQYDHEIQAMFAQVGKEEGVTRLRRRILDAIATAYPKLAAECARQARTDER